MSNFLIDYEAIEQYVKNLVVKNNMNEWFNKLSFIIFGVTTLVEVASRPKVDLWINAPPGI
jgi:hypothetical protein